MTKWIVFDRVNDLFNIQDIDDVEAWIEDNSIHNGEEEILIALDDARALIESEDAKEVTEK